MIKACWILFFIRELNPSLISYSKSRSLWRKLLGVLWSDLLPRLPRQISSWQGLLLDRSGTFKAFNTLMEKDPPEPDHGDSRNIFLWHALTSRSSCFFQVPGASVILFNFTFFNIVDQTDMVELLDGYSNQVLARFDGRNPPRDVVNVTADFVILYFYSDRTNEAQGFSVLYHGEDTL